jgi:hypothetical protein
MPRKAESLRIPRPIPPAYDPDVVDGLIDQAFESRDWLVADMLGETTQDLDALRNEMLRIFMAQHAVTSVATNRSRKTFHDLVQEKAVTKFALYCEVFPDGPAARGAPASEEEQAAKEHLANYLWKQSTTTNRSGWLQKALADSNLVVLEAKVYATDATVPPQPGRYVTDVELALLDFIETKVIGDVRRKIDEADAWLATLMSRNPNIALPAAKKAKALIKAAVDSAVHANPTYVRDTMAITSGVGDDDEPEDDIEDDTADTPVATGV